ncbi:hypothetical protein [Buchnera aphidicola]
MLGSTGLIGVSTLSIVRRFLKLFKVIVLSAKKNVIKIVQ